MASVFRLPAVGDTMVEAEIVEWLVDVGDEVSLDQVICSIETDKSVVEMTTPFVGTVIALGGEIGDLVQVGEPLIVVGDPGESYSPESDDAAEGTAVSSGDASAGAGLTVADPAVAVDSSGTAASDAGAGLSGAGLSGAGASAAASEGGAVKALPKARKLARDNNIDLATVAGTGPGGQITTADVEAAVAARAGAAMAAGAEAGGPAGPGERREPLSATRRAIAAHMTRSAQEIPQFTAMVDVDASALLLARAALAEQVGGKVPLDALLVAALVPALKDNPLANARFEGDSVVYYDRYDIGLAVDTPDGLMVPVVQAADAKSLEELSQEIVRLSGAARDRKLTPAEMSGATATVNNVGAVGLMAGTPMLPLATSTIVGFGLVRPVLQLRDGEATEVPTMTISATFDHRLMDGGAAGKFLANLRHHLQ